MSRILDFPDFPPPPEFSAFTPRSPVAGLLPSTFHERLAGRLENLRKELVTEHDAELAALKVEYEKWRNMFVCQMSTDLATLRCFVEEQVARMVTVPTDLATLRCFVEEQVARLVTVQNSDATLPPREEEMQVGHEMQVSFKGFANILDINSAPHSWRSPLGTLGEAGCVSCQQKVCSREEPELGYAAARAAPESSSGAPPPPDVSHADMSLAEASERLRRSYAAQRRQDASADVGGDVTSIPKEETSTSKTLSAQDSEDGRFDSLISRTTDGDSRPLTSTITNSDALKVSVCKNWRRVVVRLLSLSVDLEPSRNSAPSEHENVASLLQKTIAGREVKVGTCSSLVSSPTSTIRLAWDMTSVVLIGYEMIIFPLAAFNLEETPALIAMGWLTAVFWLVDLFSQFFVGYYKNGITEMRLKSTAMRYIKSWLCMDLMIVVSDWLFIGLQLDSDASGIIRIGKSLRVIRVLKALRVARIARFMELVQALLDMGGVSEGVLFAVRIVQLVFIVILINHFVACSWYYIGRSSELADKTEANWVQAYKVDEESTFYQYLISLHWSLAQLTPGQNEVFPQNESERLFGIIMLIFGMVGFSSFVSKITSQMTQMSQYNLERSTQDYNLRKFLGENHVSSRLSGQIWNYLRTNHCTVGGKLYEKDARLLKDVPESLVIELHVELYSPILLRHPLFRALAETSGQTFYNMCHLAISTRNVLSRHLLFLRDDKAQFMSFVARGEFEFTERRPHSLESNPEAKLVCEGDWVGELALWIDWVHCGFLIASRPSEVYQIDAATFKKLSAKGQGGSACIAKYGRAFAAYLQMAPARTFGRALDLGVGIEAIDGMVKSAFPHVDNSAVSGLKDRLLGRGLLHYSAAEYSTSGIGPRDRWTQRFAI